MAVNVPLPNTVHDWQPKSPSLSQRSQLGQTPQNAKERAAQGRGRLEEEGSPCGACWVLSVKEPSASRALSPLGLSSLGGMNAVLPFFPGCLSLQGRPPSRQGWSLSSGVGGSQ